MHQQGEQGNDEEAGEDARDGHVEKDKAKVTHVAAIRKHHEGFCQHRHHYAVNEKLEKGGRIDGRQMDRGIDGLRQTT